MMYSPDEIEQIAALVAAKSPSTFLSPEEISVLTGRKSKSRQIEALREMGVAFFVNGIGHAVVARSTIEGGKAVTEPPKREWVPPGLRKK